MHVQYTCTYIAADPLPHGEILRGAFIGISLAETCGDVSRAVGF